MENGDRMNNPMGVWTTETVNNDAIYFMRFNKRKKTIYLA